MKKTDYMKHVRHYTEEMCETTARKNKDYSFNDDALSNFKEIAVWLGVNPMIVWAVLFLKHVSALCRYARDQHLDDETVHDRFKDCSVYCMLGDALIKDLFPPEEDDESNYEVTMTVDEHDGKDETIASNEVLIQNIEELCQRQGLRTDQHNIGDVIDCAERGGARYGGLAAILKSRLFSRDDMTRSVMIDAFCESLKILKPVAS